MLRAIPLLAIVIIAYNVIAFLVPQGLTAELLALTFPSGGTWTLNGGQLLETVGLFLLYIEILKSTRTTVASILDHGLSLLLFVVSLIEFIVVPQAATGVFFLLILLTLLDVVAGFTVTISGARRDVELGRE